MNSSLQRPLPPSVVAESDEMRELVAVVRAIAPTMITVLLTGESGTGKEVFARLIHDWSARANGAFVTVNCGAIPEGLIESELFGHEKGAFTGATGDRKGFFEAAHGGTIFLDEVGEMPLAAQVKLLRVLETGRFTRVGSIAERTTDARIIAATNRDLEQEVRAGRFRADLYYRLRAVMLRLPPLRNRRDDIPALVDAILSDLIKRHSLPHKPHLETGALEQLSLHGWKGNVRELRNVLEQLAVLAFAPGSVSTGTITAEAAHAAISSQDGFEWNHESIFEPKPQFAIQPMQSFTAPPAATDLTLIYRALLELRSDISDIKQALHLNGHAAEPKALPPVNMSEYSDLNIDAHEQRLITEALERFGGDRAKAASALGISERTLYRKLRSK